MSRRLCDISHSALALRVIYSAVQTRWSEQECCDYKIRLTPVADTTSHTEATPTARVRNSAGCCRTILMMPKKSGGLSSAAALFCQRELPISLSVGSAMCHMVIMPNNRALVGVPRISTPVEIAVIPAAVRHGL